MSPSPSPVPGSKLTQVHVSASRAYAAPDSKMTPQESPVKPDVGKDSRRVRAPFESLDVESVLTRAKALLRGRHPRASYQAMAQRVTRLEDWLEYERPRSPYREALGAVRRVLEVRGG